MSVDVPVVVVGAGPTGVTAATLLAGYGVPCLLLDRWEEVYPQPRAVHLDDEIHRIVAKLGLADAFATISRPADGLRLLDRRHRVLAEFDRSGISPHNGFPRANMFDQPALEALLRSNLSQHPSVTYRGNAEVTSVQEVHPGIVDVTFHDLVTSDELVVRTRFVLGCDGANSVVRASIGSTLEDLGFEQRWLVVDVETKADLQQWEGVHQICDARRAATYMRVGDTRYRWEFQLLEGESAASFPDLGSLVPLIAPWTADVPAADLELVRVAEYTFHAKVADRWREGNVFLLGDAAHLTPPFIGQGMGAGVRDAANLAWKLHGVLSGQLPHGVLDSYEPERRPHARAVITLAKLMGALMTSGGTAGNVLRRLVAPRVALLPGLRKRVRDSETPALCGSTWVGTSRSDRLAGRLCPNAVLAGGLRYDDRVGGSFALVTTVPLSPTSVAELAARRCEVVQVEPDSGLGGWLWRGRAAAALVRPDSTVMMSGVSPSMLAASFSSRVGLPDPVAAG